MAYAWRLWRAGHRSSVEWGVQPSGERIHMASRASALTIERDGGHTKTRRKVHFSLSIFLKAELLCSEDNLRLLNDSDICLGDELVVEVVAETERPARSGDAVC